jgi:hypothetical protein
VFPSYFPTLHTADNSSWAVFTYLPVKKNSSLHLPNQSVHRTRLWGLSWASFDQAMKIEKRTCSVPRPVSQVWRVSVLNWGFWLVPRTVARESRFPVGKRIHTWMALPGIIWTEFCWPNIEKYYSLSKEQEGTVSFSFLNLASVKLEPVGPPHCVKSEVMSFIFNIFN